MASPADLAHPPRLRRVLRSFGFAIEGLGVMLRTQPNFVVHVTAAVLALVLAVALGFSSVEVALVVLTIALVLVLECLNTALEAVSDVASSQYHPLIKRAKDVSAAAVLVSAIGSVIIAIVLYVPRLVAVIR